MGAHKAPVKIHRAVKNALRGLNDDTKTFFLRNFGCARKVYNLYVDFLYEKLEQYGYKEGEKLPDIKIPEVKDLSVRKWTCPECGAVHDRDVNAAVNIKNEGINIIKRMHTA